MLFRISLFLACAIPASIEDASRGWVQRKWTDFLLVLLPAASFAEGGSAALSGCLLASAGAVLLCALASKAVFEGSRPCGMGAADLRMAGAVGALEGFRFFLSAASAAIVLSLPFTAVKTRKSFPFVPSLAAGTAWALFEPLIFSRVFRAETLAAAITFAG